MLLLLILLGLSTAGLTEEAGEVRVGSRAVFVLEASVGSITPRERADILNRRIEQILTDPALDPQRIQVREGPHGGTLIALDDVPVLSVTRFDAELNQTEITVLAEQWAELLRSRINQVKPLYASRPKIEIKTLSEHHILLMIVQVTSLLLSARLFGALAVALGQPAVIGQLVAGIVLGRSVLGSLFPDLQALVFPVEATQAYLLEVFSWLGVILLLMLTGLETDLPMMRRQGRAALWAVALGVLLPFALGFGVGQIVSDGLLVEPDSRLTLALFLGTALSVSSVPVVARILAEMGVLRRSLGQLILTAALGHDTIGWLMLALVAGLASHGTVDLGNFLRTLLGTLGFLLVMFTVGRRLIYGGLRRLARSGQDAEGAVLTAMIVVTLVSAGVTHVVGVHAVLGAFVAGVILSGSAVIDEKVVHPIESVTMALFAPIFFAAAGLHVNLWGIFRPEVLPYAVLLTLAATVGKIGAGFLAGRLAGLDGASALALGVGTNARGAMGLILGILGFSLGLITVNMFTMLIVMALVTTAMTPPLLSWLLRHVKITPEEQARLEQQEWHATSSLARIRSILLAVSGGPHARAAAELVADLALSRPVEVEALVVEASARPVDATRTLAAAAEAFQAVPEHFRARTLQSDSVVDTLKREAAHADLLAVGAGAETSERYFFSPLVDQLVQASLRPVLVVRGPASASVGERILLAVPSTHPAGLATELSVALARARAVPLVALQVVEDPPDSYIWRREQGEEIEEHARELVQQVALLAQAYQVEVDGLVRHARHAGPAIVAAAEELGAGLIVLNGTLRPTVRLFFGPTLPYVLEHSQAAVAVVLNPR